MRLFLALLLCLPAAAQDRLWTASVVVYGGAQAADAASSWGKPELNPLLRSADGRFGGRGVAIKSAITGTVIFGEWLILRKRPALNRSLAYVNFASAGVVGLVVTRNARLRASPSH